MRRLALIAAAALAGAILLAAGPGATSSDAGDSLRVDALFDNAAGVVDGQDVKVAGAPAGRVLGVELTEDRLARVQMEIQAPFAPFRADARCEVRPQSLIGERFVQCDPGTPAAGALEAADGETPTVPVEQTSAPIDLDLVFDTLRRPYRERLAIVLNELGAGFAGRGEDLNRIIRNANPALKDARRLLATLDAQRAEIQAAIVDTDRVVASVAERPEAVGDFLRGAASVSERVGRHDTALSEGVARLPALLAEAGPALRELEGLSIEALPLLRGLRRSAPGANRLFAELRPFARGARPTVRRLGRAAVPGRAALDASVPFADAVRRALEGLEPIAPTARELVTSLVDRGFTEGLMRFVYNATLATSRFDEVSHIFPAHLVGSACSFYNDTNVPDELCHGRFEGSFTQSAAARGAKRTGLEPADGPAGAGGGEGGGSADVPSLDLPELDPPDPEPVPSGPTGETVRGLLDFLLNP